MINAITSARITLAGKLYGIRNELTETRSYIPLTDSDVQKIDNMVLEMDGIINKVMGAMK